MPARNHHGLPTPSAGRPVDVGPPGGLDPRGPVDRLQSPDPGALVEPVPDPAAASAGLGHVVGDRR